MARRQKPLRFAIMLDGRQLAVFRTWEGANNAAIAMLTGRAVSGLRLKDLRTKAEHRRRKLNGIWQWVPVDPPAEPAAPALDQEQGYVTRGEA